MQTLMEGSAHYRVTILILWADRHSQMADIAPAHGAGRTCDGPCAPYTLLHDTGKRDSGNLKH